MVCSCKKKSKQQFVWTAADGETTVTYNTEIEAKAKVLRRGGTYAPKV
jgi:hypothetical protein